MVGCPRLKYVFCQYLLESSLERACSCRGMHAAIVSLCKGLAGVLSPVEGQGPPQTVAVQHLCDASVSLVFQIERQLSSSQ